MTVQKEVPIEVQEEVLAAALDTFEHETVDGLRCEPLGPASARCPDREGLAGQSGIHPPRDPEDRVSLCHG
jgi:hypothetical protein